MITIRPWPFFAFCRQLRRSSRSFSLPTNAVLHRSGRIKLGSVCGLTGTSPAAVGEVPHPQARISIRSEIELLGYTNRTSRY